MAYLNNVLVGTLILMVHIMHGIYSRKIQSPEEPLYLTPYIEQGDIAGGQKASVAESLLHGDNTVSYSGYFTVNKTYNSNMFFWFFPAEKDSANVPLIIWLQGGPGLSSIWGLFELGVYKLDNMEKLSKRDLYWSQKYNMLYLDNPIGTGFSFTEQDEGYSRTATDIGNNLYNALKQFYQLFPEFKRNDLYIAGSSYAGKFVPDLAYTIDLNQNESNKINLKGMMIGNGFSDPATIINRSKILYQLGMIGIKFKAELDGYIQEMVTMINQGKYENVWNGNTVMRKAIRENSGYTNLYNLLYENEQFPFGDVDKFINTTRVKSKIHAGNRSFETNPKVFTYIRDEYFQSVKPWVEQLLEKYKLLMYSGQLDLEIPYILNSEYLQSLKWSGAEDFKKAERKLWYLDNQLVGYTQTGGRLSEVLVRNAGHDAHVDKPKEVLDMIDKFISMIAT